LALDEAQEDFVQEIAMKTQGFTEITRTQCEQLIQNITEILGAYSQEGGKSDAET